MSAVADTGIHDLLAPESVSELAKRNREGQQAEGVEHMRESDPAKRVQMRREHKRGRHHRPKRNGLRHVGPAEVLEVEIRRTVG
jgi:hypothetical protein